MTEIKFDTLTEIEEIQSILGLYDEAKKYLESFDWCISTKKCWYDIDHGIYEKIGIFFSYASKSRNAALTAALPAISFVRLSRFSLLVMNERKAASNDLRRFWSPDSITTAQPSMYERKLSEID